MVRVMHNFKYRDFKKVVNSMGGIPNDLWKNAWLKVYQGKNTHPEYIYYPITGNNGNVLTVGYDDNSTYSYRSLTNAWRNKYNSTRIDNLWRPGWAAWSVFPEVSDYWFFPTQYRQHDPLCRDRT